MKLGICGLGLIGSSVARAMVTDHEVLGLDPDPQAAEGSRELGVDMVSDTVAMSGCDLILLAAPTAVNDALLRHLMASGHEGPVADLGSVKAPIVDTWLRQPDFPFVATHPMAGSAEAGVQAGSVDLFHGAAWPVVVDSRTDPEALRRVVELIVALGAHVVPVSPAAHDRAIAVISHLPHLAAGAVGTTVAADPQHGLAIGLAAGSFRDATRVSASPAQRTSEFITMNSPHSAAAARAAAAELLHAADILDSGDAEALANWLEQARELRMAYESLGSAPRRDIPCRTPQDLCELLAAGRDSGMAVVGLTADSASVVGDRP